MASLIKHVASGNRRRYIDNGFDLDLTYIKPNIVAMGFPGDQLEGIYKNYKKEVVRFFDERHPDHYKVYNLCSERSYDPSNFHGRVATYPFDNEKPPPFKMIKFFCEDVHEWLNNNGKNVAVVHCCTGLGRTGVMICSYLCHDRLLFFDSAYLALAYFDATRTKNATGVSLPSQRRYVQYYHHLLKSNMVYARTTALAKGITFIDIPNIQGGTCSPYFTIRVQTIKAYTSKVFEDIKRTDSTAELPLSHELPLCGDVEINFYHQSRIGREKMFGLWFNTFFIEMHLQQQISLETKKINTRKLHKLEHEVASESSDSEGEDTASVTSLNLYRYRAKSQSKSFRKALKRAGRHAGIDITTGIATFFLSDGKVRSAKDTASVTSLNLYRYKAKSQSKSFRKALKRAGRHAGIDITTGIATFFLSDDKVWSASFTQNSEDYTTIVFPQSELDIPYKYKKLYPDDFEVHIHLKNLGYDDHSSSGTISDSKECDSKMS